MAMTLAGCKTSGSPQSPMLPPLPADLAAGCADPGVRAGRSALTERARNRQALAECRRRHGDTVTFYDDLRTRLGGQGE
jgi:hypothetical protein